jgi:hypothetical protein
MQTQKFNYVSRDGFALDDHDREILDDTGAPFIVPEEKRADYDLGYRPHETPTNDE